MNHIIAVDNPQNFFEFDDLGELTVSGVTPAGSKTSTIRDIVYGPDEDILGLLSDNQTAFPDLPSVGEWLEIGYVYNYSDTLVKVRQSHYRTIDDPLTTYSLFFVHQEGEGMDWIAGEWVEIGTVRQYNSVSYRCIQKHQTLDTNNPELTNLILWVEVVEGIPEWEQPGSTNPYMTGDQVTFEGSTYTSVIDNNVWSPSAYPAGWKIVA